MLTEKKCTGSYAYTRDDFQSVIDAIDSGKIDPLPLITKRIRLEEILENGINLLRGTGKEAEAKIMVAGK
jgi:threonine dehydrogenase-like Zn-dependent dehydrogenase